MNFERSELGGFVHRPAVEVSASGSSLGQVAFRIVRSQ